MATSLIMIGSGLTLEVIYVKTVLLICVCSETDTHVIILSQVCMKVIKLKEFKNQNRYILLKRVMCFKNEVF